MNVNASGSEVVGRGRVRERGAVPVSVPCAGAASIEYVSGSPSGSDAVTA